MNILEKLLASELLEESVEQGTSDRENSDLQTIELVHWIMALSDEQLAAMAGNSSMPMEVEDALNHLNSDASTPVTEADLQEWVNRDMILAAKIRLAILERTWMNFVSFGRSFHPLRM